MTHAHPARHLLRAKDLAGARHREPLDARMPAAAAEQPPASGNHLRTVR